MRISRLQLKDVKRYRDLQIDLAPGLTVVRGPNEAGKTTIARALELALSQSVNLPLPEVDALRSWDAEPAATPTVEVDFSHEGSDGAERHGSVRKAFGAGGGTKLTLDGETTTEPSRVDELLADLTGLPTPAFFRSTALVRHGELDDLDRDEANLRERLAASISAANQDTARAIAELEAILADLNVRSERTPGRLWVAEEAVARAQAAVDAGDAALAHLVADRATLGAAEIAREEGVVDLAGRRALLAHAQRAEVLSAELGTANERLARYTEAVTVAEALRRLHDNHPATEPLPVLRQIVERLRALEATITELRAMLSGEVKVNYEVSTPGATWRPTAIFAIVVIVVGFGLAAVGRLITGVGVLLPIGIAAVAVGAVVAYIGIRQRRRALDMRTQKQLADIEIDRRLRGRSQMEAELKQAEADMEAQLKGLGLDDLPAAEDLLAREETHVSAIDHANGRLQGLVGKEPTDALPGRRDAARAEVDEKTTELDGLPEEARVAGATEGIAADVRVAEATLDAARNAEAKARADVEANTVDAEQVAGEAERLAIWQDQLAGLQRRARIHEAALGGLERATAATMARATRYLEKRMVEGVSRVTEGRYRRVRIDDQTLDIQLVAPEKGDWVDARELSGGTLELVYLVARLGLIRHATGDRRPPIVLDDPLVSFDDERAAQAFAILRELTRDHQVIYLTSSDRYDAAADAVVELPGPTAIDAEDEADTSRDVVAAGSRGAAATGRT